ncbi:lipase 3-like isoform X2 [Thrips palmi]|uniref:Lipase 3-like isoform X2 n=1 Tax=Thrips palmi TaxID=161013 RepID=A0A6P8ZYU9_THRPL|nr:lipase 3-like isoform X2 [Thrips palmi]
MDNYLILVFLIVIATLCWMAGVVKVLLAVVLLGTAVSLAADPKSDLAADRLMWSAYLLSKEGPTADLTRRRPFNPLLDLDPVGLIQHYGYPAERHHVTTDDGYILGIHRIPGSGSSQREAVRRPAVILAHPLLSTSAEWLVAGPEKALAFLLADEGFDVWLLNVRGNTYCLNHTTLSPHDDAFWDFSFHEHAVLDLPATIQYVVRETGQQQVQYVGFSMGTTIMFVMASERPDVAKHVTMFTALGPATALVHSRSYAWRALAHASGALKRMSRMLHTHRFLPSTAALRTAGEVFCSDGSITQSLCVGLIAALAGRNDAQFNKTMLPYIISRTPSGTSFKNIDHFAQSLKQGFQQYDYGHAENLRRYGSAAPPKYNVGNVNLPTRLYYGMNDHLADWTDAQKLCSELPNVLSCDAVKDPLWTHLDFVWAKDVVPLVYNKLIADLKESSFPVRT